MKKTWVFRCIGLLLFTISMVLCSGNSSEVHAAATSHTNAKEYYNSVDLSHGGLETYGGDLYHGTKAKKATSSSNLRYRTIGFEITVFSGSDSVTFCISRTGSYVDNSIPEVDSTEGGTAYQYSLWRIPWENIKSLATTVNSSAANRIFQSSSFTVRVSHIMTTFQGSNVHGYITENGNGTVTPSGTVYYLSNSSHLASMKAIFTRHDFAGMFNVTLPMYNPSLTVYYNANGGTVSYPYTIGTFAGASNMVYSSGSILKESKTLYQTMNLYNDTTLGLTRTGYHLDSGKEWTFSGKAFNQNYDYNTVDINSNVRYGNDNAVMTANWQPNTYYIKYDANGGKGSLSNSTLTYDSNGTIRTNTFTKTGYKLREGAEWNTQADGSGTTYTSNQVVKNLTSTNGATITLYAQWEPCEYKISTYKDGGTGGNDYFYELYNTRYFNSEETKDTAISSIELPTKTGHIFNGYFTGINGLGTQIVDSDGNILVSNTYYLYNSYVYASWTPKEYTVTFDKQGGTMGTDSATVRYNETYPSADAPVKMEYTFKGYYSHPDGRGEMYYTENMAPLKRHTVDYDITLYAKWVDEAIPRTSIEVATVNWTRDPDGIDVIGRAVDKGSGLDYAELYCGNTKVAEARDLNGANSVELTAVHKEEGIFRYRIVAYDLAGNKSESYENVKYDVTSPEAEGDTPGKDEVQYEYTLANEQATVANLSNFTIELFVTDYKYDWGTGSEIGAYYKDGTFIPWSTLIKKGIVTSTEIPWGAFTGTNGEGLVKIVMSNRVTRVWESAFEYCADLETIQFSKSLTQIDDYAFRSCTSLKNVVIPDTITQLGMGAFEGCTGLESVSIPDTLETINEYTFYGCTGLKEIVIPSGVKTVSDYAFDGCSGVRTITVPDTVTSIGTNAFPTPMFGDIEGYWFDEVINQGYAANEIPTGVSAVYKAVKPDGLFDANGVMLASWDELINTYGFDITSGTSFRDILDGYSELSTGVKLIIGDGVTSIGNEAFYYCKSLESIVIPEGVTSIGDWSFYNCGSLESIVIPEGVTRIKEYAFGSCPNLQSITLPSTLTQIGIATFSHCSNLESIVIPEGVTSIGRGAFDWCDNLKSVTLPSTLSSIELYTFNSCKSLESIVIPEGVTSIGMSAFYGCDNLQSITLPSTLSSIGTEAIPTPSSDYIENATGYWFNESTLDAYTSDNIPLGIAATYIADVQSGLYDDSNNLIASWDDLVSVYGLDIQNDYGINDYDSVGTMWDITHNYPELSGATKIIIDDSVTSIGDYSFSHLSSLSSSTALSDISSIIIPSSVTSIGHYAFDYCDSLSSIYIPKSVSSIDYSFNSCSNLKSIIVDSNNSYYDSRNDCNAIIETETNILIQGCGNTVIPNTVVEIGSHAFYGNDVLSFIEIPSSVTSIGSYAFSSCTSLQDVQLSENITVINSGTFSSCRSLSKIVIPDGVTSIGSSAFNACISLESVELSENLSSIDSNAFGACSSLKSVELPGSIGNIGSYAFSGCSSLKNIIIPDRDDGGVVTINNNAFNNCTGLTSVYLSASVTRMSNVSLGSQSPFYGCSSSCKIYCGATSKRPAWGNYWNYYSTSAKLSVTWGVTQDVYESTYK